MARPSDSYPREGGVTHSIETYREALGSSGGQGSREKSWARAFIVVFMGRKGPGRESSLGLASLNNSSGSNNFSGSPELSST